MCFKISNSRFSLHTSPEMKSHHRPEISVIATLLPQINFFCFVESLLLSLSTNIYYIMDRPKYPVGIQTFSEIISNGYVYVDKTEFIHRLVSRGKYYFLSRPRRFGKSLLVSTLESFFRGQKELFKGLWIYDREWDWQEYPVFHLALNGQDYTSVESLNELLHNNICRWERLYGLQHDDNIKSPAVRFSNVIERVSEKTGRQVAILIDEYDQPMLQNIEEGKEELYEQMRQALQGFYSVLKVQDRYIKFGFLTGITKFSKVSVFSGLNNLNDISLDRETNAICGISESELGEYFGRGISDLAEANGMTPGEARAMLKQMFDGYHFSAEGEDIYNPFSLLTTFEKNAFGSYWFESGTPSFLIKLVQKNFRDYSRIGEAECSESDLKGSDIYRRNPVPLLYQSGYLTIKGYDREFNEYTLDYPNEEVAHGFARDLLKICSRCEEPENIIKNFVKSVRRGDTEGFMELLQSLFADIPYDQIPDRELHYENMMYLVMKLMGFYTRTEYRTSGGRIDMVVDTDRYIYIMELKLNGTAREALAQIKEREYALPFRKEGKELILIGANFTDTKRRLDSWVIEKV